MLSECREKQLQILTHRIHFISHLEEETATHAPFDKLTEQVSTCCVFGIAGLNVLKNCDGAL